MGKIRGKVSWYRHPIHNTNNQMVNIIKPYAKIMDGPFPRSAGIKLLQLIEKIGRVSHRSEDKQTEDSWEKFIPAIVLGHGDWSIVEHAHIIVEAVVDRGITHEWVRHRIGAYTQESTRFVNYEKKIPPSFIRPFENIPRENPFIEQNLGPIGIDMEKSREANRNHVWENTITVIEKAYKTLIELGTAPQTARSVFPNALASKLIVTYNLRNWRHFFLMRTSKEAHPQMREVTIPLLKEFQECIPILYDDIIPERRQIENLRMPR